MPASSVNWRTFCGKSFEGKLGCIIVATTKELKMKNKHIIVFLALLISLVIFAGGVSAQGGNKAAVVVVATGDDTADCERPDLDGVFVTQDVCNVQAAVNAGGKILLKGTFHFAEYGEDGYVVKDTDGTVFITNDVEIKGEKQESRFLTTIKGGYMTFSVGYEPIEWVYDFTDEIFTSPDNAVPVQVTIQDIHFENTLYTPIRIWSTTDATVKSNKIVDGRSFRADFYCGGPGCHGMGFGVMVGPPGALWADYPQLISGNILITDNFMDGRYRRADVGDPWAEPSYNIPVRGLTYGGIFMMEYTADVEITNNEVYNFSMAHINVGGGDGTTRISENIIDVGPEDSEIRPNPYGIWANGWWFQENPGIEKYTITENDINMGNNPEAWGIFLNNVVNDPVIEENRIRVQSDSGAGIVLWDTSNATIAENQLVGKGLAGVALFHWPEFFILTDNNMIKENKLNSFNASLADYYLAEEVFYNTLYVKMHDTVLDDSGNDTNMVFLDD